MNDREKRRKRILENSKFRLEKLEQLKKSDDGARNTNEFTNDTTHLDENLTSKLVEDDGCLNDAGRSCHELNLDDSLSFRTVGDSQPKEMKVAIKTSETNWIVRKRRTLLFALLAWVAYLTTIKGLDFLFASFFSYNLSKDVLGNMVLVLFISVELQVILADVWLGNVNSETCSVVMVIFKLSGLPSNLVFYCDKIMICCNNILNDFSVYLFILVFLCAFDNF